MVKLRDIHSFAVEKAKKMDPRDESKIEELLEEREEEYEELEGPRKEAYDKDRLDNPYDDSKVIYGGEKEVEHLAVGVDMEVQELLLIDKLNEKGEDIDGIFTHHPVGRAMANLYEVLGLQVDILSKGGIPVSQAEALVRPRTDEVKKSIHPGNHPRTPRVAELLGIPMVSFHTAADNYAFSFVGEYLDEEDPETLEDLVDSMLEIPEYEWALNYDMEPQIHSGKEDNRVGEMGVFGFTGGTDLGEDVIEKMVNSGIDTMVAMHAPKDQIEEAEEQNINIITAGHMPSDSVGINLLLDDLKEEFDLEFLEMSGFKRIERL